MIYFKILSIVLGAGMILSGAYTVVPAESMRRFVLRLYPEARPSWLPAVGTLILALVLWTWWQFTRAVSMENFVVTLVMSLGLVKVAPMVFYYKKSREFLLALVGEPLAFRVVVLSSAAVGLALLMMALFF